MTEQRSPEQQADAWSVPRRLGYLGPAGTFTQQALRSWLASASPSDESNASGASSVEPPVEEIPFPSVGAALAALLAGEVDAAMVPIENSVEGGVSATLDSLAHGEPLVVVAEVRVPVTFVLAAPTGTALADVRTIGTHSHAWAQVRRFVAEHLPDVDYVPTLSTAAAAAALGAGAAPGAAREAQTPSGGFDAAVCAPGAAADHGLVVLANDIGDNTGAVTRFVLVARPGRLPAPTGADKTTVVLFQRLDQPGGLLALLEQLAVRGINMTRLESRPTKEELGSYCFSVDIEGHVSEPRVAEALMGLYRVCAHVRFLGSYPSADPTTPTVTASTGAQAFEDARDWLRSITG